MFLTIGPTVVQLELPPGDLGTRLAARYGAFAAPTAADAPAFRLALRLHAEPPRPDEVANPPLVPAGDLDRARLTGRDFSAELDWVDGRGRATLPDSVAHVDLLLRVVFGIAALRAGGVLLHASAVVRDRFGIAFTGPSGAGKSTVARACREAGLDVLADEMIGYRTSGVGARFDGTPFWHGTPRSAPAGGLMFLVQAPRPAVRQVTPARALPRLLAAGGAPLDLPAVHDATFAASSALLRRVPAYELEFTPDASFWSVLDRLPEFAWFRPAAPAPEASPAPRPVPLGTLPPRPARGA